MSPWKPISSGNSSIVRSLIQKTEPCDLATYSYTNTRKSSREGWSKGFIYTFQCKSLGTAVYTRQGAHGIGTFQLLLHQTSAFKVTAVQPEVPKFLLAVSWWKLVQTIQPERTFSKRTNPSLRKVKEQIQDIAMSRLKTRPQNCSIHCPSESWQLMPW